MSLDLYAAYVVACVVIIMAPGPTVASSMRRGVRACLWFAFSRTR